MNQFLQRLQSIKSEKLAEFTQFLVLQEKSSLESLETQVAQLQATIGRTARTAKTQREAKKAFDTQIQERFALETHKQALLALFWNEISAKHFEKDSIVKKWLTEQIEELSTQGVFADGELRAGASYEVLKKISLPKSISLKKDASITEHGFVLESKDTIVDCLLSTYLSEKYKAHRADLYLKAFSSDSSDELSETKKKSAPKKK
jgi:hypothetical protein